MRVLINATVPSNTGGVAKYFARIRPHMPSGTIFCTVGRRGAQGGLIRNGARLCADYVSFARKLLRDAPDVVHLNPSLDHGALLRDAVFLLVAKMFGKKVIVFFRGWNTDFERAMKKVGLSAFRAVYFRADAMIVLASEFRQKLRDLGYRKRVFLENTVVSDFLMEEVQEDGSPEDRDVHNGFNILYLARIEEAKGIYEALEAFNLLRRRNPEKNIRLSVAGDGSEMEGVRARVAERGIEGVRFLGYVSGQDKAEEFRQADAYLFPTRHGEGLPASVLEAMAAGLPVVTRPVGGIKDFFADGEMGFLTQETTPEAFAEYMERLLSDWRLREAISKHNASYAREHFTAGSAARRLGDIYRNVLDN